jgi:xanthine dehydrogenase YagS FAD-binding subunit
VRPLEYTRAADVPAALRAAGEPGARFLGGGTNLLDLMKMGVEQPTRLVDVSRLPLRDIEEHDGGARIGAMALNSDVADHPLIRRRYPVLTEAIVAGASPQLRNMATIGGNLMQRTRCPYFYDPSFAECNKRAPGSGCAARQGWARMHAILGASEHCIAVHPSDMAVALVALDATVRVAGLEGEHLIAAREFYRLPGDTPHLDTELRPGELITAIELPPTPFARRSHYLKVRDRCSYAFALVSVAAMLELDDDRMIRDARLALGGVAHRPWRMREAELVLIGRRAEEDAYREAANVLLRAAQPLPDNAFKVELARRGIVRALATTAALDVGAAE